MNAVYVHWNQKELEERLLGIGMQGLRGHWSQESVDYRHFKEDLPEVLIISLERLPSHGKAIAEWFWEAKRRRNRPLIFVGGADEKVAIIRAKFPEASFISPEELASTLELLQVQTA